MARTRTEVLLPGNLTKRIKHCRIFLILFFGFFLQVCCVFHPPAHNRVTEDRVALSFPDEPGTLAITPEARLVILNLDKNRFCADPPPELSHNMSSDVQAALKYRERGTPDSEAPNTVESSEKELLFRTQGVQFFRDAAYYYCQLYLTSVIDKAGYLEKIESLIPIANELIKQEIPYLSLRSKDIPQNTIRQIENR